MIEALASIRWAWICEIAAGVFIALVAHSGARRLLWRRGVWFEERP
jgi:hypothetical protein